MSYPSSGRAEHDLDIRDDFHGTDGPIPISRRHRGDWPALQSVFHEACVESGFPLIEDMNGPDPSGVAPVPMNNLNGVRMSTAITHLSPMRHRLNLTIRGNVFVRKILMKDRRVVGVEAESGGERFAVEADKVILSAGALKSPHILMLSGHRPTRPVGSLRNSGNSRVAGRGPEPLEPPYRFHIFQG